VGLRPSPKSEKSMDNVSSTVIVGVDKTSQQVLDRITGKVTEAQFKIGNKIVKWKIKEDNSYDQEHG